MIEFYIPGDVFYFDLELPIRERFAILFPKYIPMIKKYCQQWIECSKPSQDYLQKLEDSFDSHPDKELIEYCQFLSEQCQIERKIFLYMQYMYDFGFDDSLSLGCTSILINAEKPYIVRNLDWDFHEVIRALTINAIFLKNNKIVSYHLSIVPQILIPHTIKNDRIALSLNYLWPHYTLKQQWDKVINNPKILSIQRLIYHISISDMNYEDLSKYLEKQIVQHHGLLNIVGNKKGQCSIFYVSDWFQANKYPHLKEIEKNEQFLLSTNGDYFKFSVERYNAALMKLQQFENFNQPEMILKDVAMQYPNYNETTILSTILEPYKQNEFKVFIK